MARFFEQAQKVVDEGQRAGKLRDAIEDVIHFAVERTLEWCAVRAQEEYGQDSTLAAEFRARKAETERVG